MLSVREIGTGELRSLSRGMAKTPAIGLRRNDSGYVEFSSQLEGQIGRLEARLRNGSTVLLAEGDLSLDDLGDALDAGVLFEGPDNRQHAGIETANLQAHIGQHVMLLWTTK